MAKGAVMQDQGTEKARGGRQKAQYLVKCTAKGCAAKAGPFEGKERVHTLALEHAISFKHATEVHTSKVLRTIDPATLPRLA